MTAITNNKFSSLEMNEFDGKSSAFARITQKFESSYIPHNTDKFCAQEQAR